MPIVHFLLVGRTVTSRNVEYYPYLFYGADGIIDPIKDYATAGCEAVYVEPLIRNLYSDNMIVNKAKWSPTLLNG